MTVKFDKTKLTKSLAQNNILVPFLDRAFDTFDEPWTFDYEEKGVDDAWHPSGDCIPQVTTLYANTVDAYKHITNGGKVQRASKDISGSLRKSFMVGHYWHQLIQYIIVNKLEFATNDDIERKGKRAWGDVTCPGVGDPVYPPYHWVTGSGDIAPMRTPRWTGIVDIKTIGGAQFKECQATKKLPPRFDSKYTAQINIYMDLFDQDKGMILGVNKDSPHDFIEFQFNRNQKLIDAIYTKWRFVSECLDEGIEPTEEDNKKFALPK